MCIRDSFHAMSDKVQFRAAVVADIKDGLQEEKEKYLSLIHI